MIRERRIRESSEPAGGERPGARAPTRTQVVRSALLCVAAIASSAPHDALAQVGDPAEACEAGRISNIFVDNRSIYEINDDDPFRWVYRLINALHVNTRAGFILRELLFSEGDCLDPLLLEESYRILESYGVIGIADIYPVAQPDGTYHVVVDTQDRWTTQFDLGVSFDQGLQLDRLNLTEANLLGRGVRAEVFAQRRREQRTQGFRLQEPRLLGTRTDANLGWGRTRSGNFVELGLNYPFVGEVGRVAMRQIYDRRDRVFTYSAADDPDFTNVLLPYRDEWAEVSMAGRLGRPGNLTLLGLGLTRERIVFRRFPNELEVAIDNDFGNTMAATSQVQDLISGQTRARSTTRVNLMIGQRNLRFERVLGLDALDGAPDLWLGTDLGLTVGRSVGLFSAEGVPSPDDIFGRARLYAGHDLGSSFVFAAAAVEGRRLRGEDNDWRDVIGEIDLYSYLRSERIPGQTLFLRASAAGGWSMDSPFQLTLGGRDAVRGFAEEHSPGARRLLLTVEDRIFFSWPWPDLIDLGLTLFADAGRVWSGDVPYGVDSGWEAALGIGLRYSLPAGSRRGGRIDLAWPLGAPPNHGPVFRFTLLELLGIGPGVKDLQLERTRRTRTGPDFLVTELGR
ncbi:MAG: BamA/TamA family outer membrane protein [Gemmatimonadota bacterium]|nr:BamA/TamA family outer membrane protein [Gemmatimonadota bacterium]